MCARGSALCVLDGMYYVPLPYAPLRTLSTVHMGTYYPAPWRIRGMGVLFRCTYAKRGFVHYPRCITAAWFCTACHVLLGVLLGVHYRVGVAGQGTRIWALQYVARFACTLPVLLAVH